MTVHERRSLLPFEENLLIELKIAAAEHQVPAGEEGTHGSPAQGRPSRRRRWVFVAGSAGAAVALSAAAVTFATHRPVVDHTNARCYSASQLRDDNYMTIANLEGTVDSAEEACSALWRQGLLPAMSPKDPRWGKPQPVPTLVTCTLDDGKAAVFPGGPQTCARLNLPLTSPRPPAR